MKSSTRPWHKPENRECPLAMGEGPRCACSEPDQNEAAQIQCDQFNRLYPIGTAVIYHPVIGVAAGIHTWTRSHAQVLSGHTAVVFVQDHSGCVALEAVEPKEPVCGHCGKVIFPPRAKIEAEISEVAQQRRAEELKRAITELVFERLISTTDTDRVTARLAGEAAAEAAAIAVRSILTQGQVTS